MMRAGRERSREEVDGEREVVRRRKEGERMTQRKERDVVMKWMERNEGGEVVRRRIERKEGERQ